MASVVYHDQLRLRPSAMQVPGAAHRTDDIVSTLDDDSGNSPDTPYIVEELAIPAEEPPMNEVVAFNARQSDCMARSALLRDFGGINAQMSRRCLPNRPSSCGPNPCLLVGTCESLVVRANHVASLGDRDGSDEGLPIVWVKRSRPVGVLVKPIDLRATGKEDSSENQFGDAVWVTLRVRQPQR